MFFAKPAGDTFAAVAKWELSGRGRASAVRGGDDSDDLWAEHNPH